MSNHRNLPASDSHIIHSFEYATEDDRLAATGFGVHDQTKIARQLDNDTYWKLINIAPIRWTYFAGSLGFYEILHELSIVSMEYNDNNQPISTIWSSGYSAIYVYNDLDALETITYFNSIDDVVEKWEFIYDEDDLFIRSTKIV